MCGTVSVHFRALSQILTFIPELNVNLNFSTETLRVNLMIIAFMLLFRNHVDNNLVNAMETQENDLGPAEGVKAKPTIMFKISSTSNSEKATVCVSV